MTGDSDIDVRIWQAVIAGLFVAVGWLVNGWQNRRERATRRAERLRDVHRALYAEIGANLENLASEERIEAHARGLIAKMDTDPDFVPVHPARAQRQRSGTRW